MKKYLLPLWLILCSGSVYTQSIGIGIQSPNPSAALDITNTNKGILIPRMPTASVAGIANPAKGLMVYDTVKNQLMVNMGSASAPNWQTVVVNSGWSLQGNTVNPAQQFLGSTNNVPLYFRVNNWKAGQLDPVSRSLALGVQAMKNNTDTGLQNIALGDSAMYSNTDGDLNVATGANALFTNTNGFLNTAIGAYAGQKANSSWAVYVGESAGINNQGLGNVMVGSKAGMSNTTGIGNTFLGNNAGGNNTTGNYNSFIGNFAGQNNAASNNTFVGNYSGTYNTSGSGNTATGANALYYNQTGAANTAIGSFSLQYNSSGSSNVAVGQNTLYSNTASNNTAVGTRALQANNGGTSNTAIGTEALYSNTNATHNMAAGFQALRANTGEKNMACGSLALTANTGGSYNTASGYAAMYLNTTGINNTASGYGALYSNTNGHYNLAEGSLALYATTTAQYNTAVGNKAGDTYDHGWNNVFVGANTNTNASGYYNVIAVGQGTIVGASSVARFGNSATVSYGGWANWTNISDGRYKTNVKENVAGLDFIMKLKPVTYNLKAIALQRSMTGDEAINPYMQTALAEKEKITYSGFIAQDVEAAARSIGYDFSGVDKPKNSADYYGLRYAEFVVPLVKAVQELNVKLTKLETLEQENAEIKKENAALLKRLEALEKAINR